MSPLRLAVAASAVQREQAIGERLGALARQARAGGAELLLLAEYFAMEAAFGATPDPIAERDRAVASADAFVAAARDAAHAHGLWLLAGSLPVRDGPMIHNRAPLVAPDGAVHWTGKHRTTRYEAEVLGITADPHPPRPIATPWGPVGVAICYDAEFPPITRALAASGAFLILVPACTDTQAGTTRVEISARACAIQNQCFAAVAPTVGQAPWLASLDVNTGRAAIFGPADGGFPDDGVIAAGPADAPAMIFADLDPTALARVRSDGAVRNFGDWPE
jgi:predicted amidohydrolase